MTRNLINQTVTLRDGRRMGLAQCGNTNGHLQLLTPWSEVFTTLIP
jgi:hypothetical protein